MLDLAVKTPCIGVCSTGIGDRVCRGCKRFAHEVINWNSYTDQEKRLINQRLGSFLAQCTRNRLLVLDADLLRQQLEAQQIRYPAHQDPHCWAYALLKAGASQIDDPGRFGLQVDAQYRDHSLDDIRRIIDEEFFVLSDAWYERYLGSASSALEDTA